MAKKLPIFLDSPEKQHIAAALIYSGISFFTVPFVLLLMSIGLQGDPDALSWFEIVFHGLNFLVAVSLFKEYLKESFDTAMVQREQLITVTATAVGLILGMTVVAYALLALTGSEVSYFATFGVLPLAEMDLFTMSSVVVLSKPILGTLCMVVLAPVTISCLYYATGFVGPHNVRAWLGFLVVALVIAYPRLCNGLTHWDTTTQTLLYITQLPVHLIACWTYRKLDSIWGPIVTLAVSNLIASIVLNLFFSV